MSREKLTDGCHNVIFHSDAKTSEAAEVINILQF